MSALGGNLGAVESFVSARGFYHETTQQNDKKIARATLAAFSSRNDKDVNHVV